MVDLKPKRLRRSYLCGPCKLHKIKCDLSAPCTPCIKFNRASQCLADPAQPPSIEERQKADERRRKLYLKKSQDVQRITMINEQPSSLRHLPPSRPLQILPPRDLASHNSNSNSLLTPHNPLVAPPNHNHNLLPQPPIQMPNGLAQILQQPQSIPSFPPLALLYLLPRYIPQYLTSPGFPTQLLISSNPLQHSSVAQGSNMVSHGPPLIQGALALPLVPPIMLLIPIIQRPSPLVEQTSTPISSKLPQLQPQNLSLKPIPLHQMVHRHAASQLPSLAGNPQANSLTNPSEQAGSEISHLQPTIPIKYEPSSVPAIVGLLKSTASSITEYQSISSTDTLSDDTIGPMRTTNEDLVMFSPLEVQQILEVIPSPSRCQVLMDLYLKADPLACIYETPELTIDLMLQTVHLLQLFASITKEASKTLTIVLIELAVGEIFADCDLSMAEKRLKVALRIRDSIPTSSSVEDTIYGIYFYYGLEAFFLWTQKLKESYLEFNRTLADILNSPDFLSAIQNKDDLGNLQALKLWLRIPGYLIEYQQFEANGTLFSTSKLKDAVIPHSRILKIVFGEEIFNRRDMASYQVLGWAAYFQELPPTIRLEEIVRRYMLLYSAVGNLTFEEASQILAKLITPPPPVTDQDIQSLARHQTTMLIFIRWLLFIRVETSYFPSLRFASYLTTQVSMFNLHLSLFRSTNAFDTIVDKCGFMALKQYIYIMVLQGIFLVALRAFLDRKARGFDLKVIFNKVKRDLTSVYTTFQNLKVYQTTLHKVPLFAIGLKLVKILIEIEEELQYSKDTLFDKIMEEVDRKIPSDTALILTTFGLLDGFLGYMEKIFDLFGYLVSSEESIKITDDLVLDGKLIEEHFDKIVGLQLTPELIGKYITDVVQKSRGSTVLRPIDMR